ncbi:unnamed protein product, partial [Phaeothamnion confervicola]
RGRPGGRRRARRGNAAAANADEQEEECEDFRAGLNRKEMLKEAKKRAKAEARAREEAAREERRARPIDRYVERQREKEKIWVERERRETEEEARRQLAAAAERDGGGDGDANDVMANATAGCEDSQALLQRLMEHIEAQKVVSLANLAPEFGLAASDVARRVEELNRRGRLTTIVDDRGRLVCVFPEEMRAMADFIRGRGRIGSAELAERSGNFVKMEGKKKAVCAA